MGSPVSGRHLAHVLDISPRQLRRLVRVGLIPQRRDGRFDQERAVPAVFANYRRRLTIAEALCRRFLPGELDARYEAEDLSD